MPDLNRPHLCPNVDPLALMTYSAQGSDVVMTMVDGRILYETAEFLTLDADGILHDARGVCGAAVPLRDGAAALA